MDLPVGVSRRIRLGDRRLNEWEAGRSGPTVLLVHGIPTHHLLWHDVVAAVAGSARVLAVDMSPTTGGRCLSSGR